MRYGFCSEGSSCLTEETRYIRTNSKMCCAVLVFSRSVVPDSATPWTVARQAPLSMGFSRQEYWSGLPCPPPGELPDPGIEPMSHALAGGFFTTSTTWDSSLTSILILTEGESKSLSTV